MAAAKKNPITITTDVEYNGRHVQVSFEGDDLAKLQTLVDTFHNTFVAASAADVPAVQTAAAPVEQPPAQPQGCLLYTSPSPRDS